MECRKKMFVENQEKDQEKVPINSTYRSVCDGL